MMLPIAAMIAESGGAAAAGGAAEGVAGAAGGGAGGLGGMMSGMGGMKGMMPKIGGGDQKTAEKHVIEYAPLPNAPATTDLFAGQVAQAAAMKDPTPNNYAKMQAQDLQSGAFADAAKRQSVWDTNVGTAVKSFISGSPGEGTVDNVQPERGSPLNEVSGGV
jgi:hypothetical protein